VVEERDLDLQAGAKWGGAPISVTELNAMARRLIEQRLPIVWVAGELSNLTRAASGHCYFSLKDDRAQVRCVMFRHRLQYIDWPLANGLQVEVRAVPSLYEARGEFQINIEFMRRAGLGALFERFEKLKTKLAEEGLFAPERKKRLPRFVRRLGIVTSPAAAALQDVLTTLRRRLPAVPIVIYPTLVQGEGAAQRIVAALDTASVRAECDVLILCRGGGSIEDLWPFNEEIVARCLARCALPVICGVGHETDFTIADFVADARAPTPTGAAELATPDRVELQRHLRALHAHARRALWSRLERDMQQVDYLGRRVIHPGARLKEQQRRLHDLALRLARCASRHVDEHAMHVRTLARDLSEAAADVRMLEARQERAAHRWSIAMHRMLERHGATLARLQAHVSALNPSLVLERGYAIVSAADGTIVRDAAQLQPGSAVRLTLGKGTADANVTATRE
jgi:exodeoxyribonuclease VII large subunit